VHTIERILIAHDGSDPAWKAFDVGVALASGLSAELQMICVEEDIPRHAEVVDELEEERERADTYFAQLVEQCRAQAALRKVEIEYVIVPGHAVKSIADYVEQNPVDLLVIGFRGHSAIYEHLWGGTAHNLTSVAKCSVLVVK
jgi:nucleotide-binding universal stress UspA family protein